MFIASGFSTYIIRENRIYKWGFDKTFIPGKFKKVSCKSFAYGALKSDGKIISKIEGFPEGNNYIDICMGGLQGIALREDGKVVSWGSKYKVPNCSFKKISAGFVHFVCIDMNNKLVAWGDNSHGQCKVPEGDFVDVISGGHHSIAFKEDGTIVAWGLNSDGQCDVPDGVYKAVSAGHYHNLGLLEDGRLIAWGLNDFGQSDVPEEVLYGCNKLSAGLNHNIVSKNGELIGWGNNFFNQCLKNDL